MKFSPAFYEVKKFYVAPLVGARIEILRPRSRFIPADVAPLVGARIEISMGLTEVDLAKVAPLVGARIEIA